MSENVSIAFRHNNWSDELSAYVEMFGMNDLIPVKWFNSKIYKSVDAVYAECVKQQRTWRELTGWNEDKKRDILL